MSQLTTSIHNINGDYQLSRLTERKYFFFNRLNNILPNFRVDQKLNIKPFVIENLKNVWNVCNPKSSPSRKLSDMFWSSLPWSGIRTELGEINVLDIGCGSGNYFAKLSEYSKKLFKSCTGIDVYENSNWKSLEKKHTNMRFFKFEGSEISKFLKNNPNFIMSQSAFEHIPNDLYYFKQISEYCERSKNPILQVHLLPSVICLDLYRLHGIRQYSSRNISKITKLFSQNSKCTLFKLGGKNSNRLHKKYITEPMVQGNSDLRETKPEDYDQKSFQAIQEDMKSTHDNRPSFYALVIETNFKENLF